MGMIIVLCLASDVCCSPQCRFGSGKTSEAAEGVGSAAAAAAATTLSQDYKGISTTESMIKTKIRARLRLQHASPALPIAMLPGTGGPTEEHPRKLVGASASGCNIYTKKCFAAKQP